MSTSTGVAPASSMAATVATAVCATVSTASPGPTPQTRSDPVEIRVVVANIDPAAVGRKGARGVLSAAVDLDDQVGEILQTDDAVTAQIEDLAVGFFTGRGQKKRLDRIIDISEIS